MNQTDIGAGILAIHMAIDNIDDGYHGAAISKLIEVSNDLFNELDEYRQERMQELMHSLQMSGAI